MKELSIIKNRPVIIIPCVTRQLVVPLKQIARIEAISNYSRIHFADGKTLVVAKVLRWFQQQLPVDIFIRVHRSHLVNKCFIKRIISTGVINLLLKTGEYIEVSRRKKAILHPLASKEFINKATA